MKKTIYSVIIILIAIAAVAAVISWKKPAQAPDTAQNPSQAANTAPKMVSVDQDSYLYGISGSYPQFPQASDAFNAKIANLINGSVADFKKSAQADYDARLEVGGDEFLAQFAKGDMYYYSVKTDVIQSTDKYVSVAVRQEAYTGGAHGYHVVATFNYDVAAAKELSLTDFMTLEKASEASRTDLKKQFADKGDANVYNTFAEDGTDPKKPENFQMFTFTDSAVKIYFNEYQVAPYVYGEMSTVIPR